MVSICLASWDGKHGRSSWGWLERCPWKLLVWKEDHSCWQRYLEVEGGVRDPDAPWFLQDFRSLQGKGLCLNASPAIAPLLPKKWVWQCLN